VKKILLATAAAAFMGLSLGVPAAHAGVTPSPTPSQQQFHQPKVNLRPEQFEIALDRVGNGRLLNTVLARGPVSLFDGNDTTVSNFLDVLDDRGPNAVNLFHDPLNQPTIFPGTCSAVWLQQANWNFRGGRGIYARETGRGTYTLTGIVSARERNLRSFNWNPGWNYSQNMNWFHRPQVCPLVGLTSFQILREVQRQALGGTPRIVFDQVAFNAQGTGFASQPRIVPVPCQYSTDGPMLNAHRIYPDPHSTCDAVPTPIQAAA